MTVMRYQSVNCSVTDGADVRVYNVEGGSVVFDESWTPFLQANLTLTLPMMNTGAFGGTGLSVLDPDALDALDPRNGLRATLVCTLYEYDEATGVLHSENDVSASLRISSRNIDWVAGTVEVLLATDEFVLSQEANRTTSPTNYRAHQTSLIAVVNAVLADVGLSATLDGSSVDADVTTCQALTNLLVDPRTTATTNYGVQPGGTLSTGTTSLSYTGKYVGGTWASAPTSPYVEICPNAQRLAVTPGDLLFMSAYILTSSTATVFLRYSWWDQNGVQIGGVHDTAGGTSSSTWYRAYGAVVVPNGAASVRVVAITTTTGLAAGFWLRVSAPLVTVNPLGTFETDGSTVLAYFDGSTSANAYYTYSWDTGTADASTSTRTPIVDRSPDSLTVSPGESYMDMLQPVVNAAGLRLFCDENGVWRLVDGASFAESGTVTIQPSNATALAELIDLTQPDIVYGSVVVKYTWVNTAGNTETYYDAAGTDSPTRLIEVQNRAYPGPGAAAYALAQGQGRGLVMTTSAMTDFSARPYQGARVIAPYEATQTGVVSRVSFDLASAEMEITTRGLIDTPAGAWILAPDSKTWSTVNGSTTWNGLSNDFSNL